MTTVRITEIAGGEAGSFTARVSFGDAAEYQVEVSDPADVATERLLAWYFEEHLRFPFLDRDIEREAVAQLRAYGEALFGQVFGKAAAYDYRRLRERSFDGCRLQVTGSAAFHLLHWEAQRDPDLDGPLSVRLPVTRRVGLLPSRFDLPSAQPTLNILLVTARPFGRGDVGYRTVSRPLLDALRQASVPVTVDLVRPGTWEAVRGHLRDRARRDGSGWYQVAHFDLHGGFSGFGELDEQRSAGRLLFAGPKVEPFEGKRPFLFFETTQEGKAAAVPAASVASLLAEHRVPVAVLNACQSAMQAGSEASLAQYLVEAGVPTAVGMAYSVTVSAAALAMPVLYGQLSRGADPVVALHATRQTLHDDPARRAYFDQELDLQDWVLPVGFSQQPVALRLRPMDEAEQARFYQHQADTGSEPTTEHGFVGRDLDIQAAERRLLIGQDSNELLVQGMAGAGKSTFLAHLAWWWQRTSLVQQVFRFSWEDRAWTAAQIIREIRARLLSPVEQAKADRMPAAAQLEQAAELLRSARHLLILDNAESITATPAAIPHAINPAEQAQLRTLLMRLCGGKTLVVVGSREAEAWLAPGTFRDNVYPLPGLDPQATTALADRILRRHHATRWLDDDAERQALHDLTDLLGGYPLPMTIVFPLLGDAAPSEILAELKEGDVRPSQTFSVARVIELSYGKLSSSMQNSLLMLAPFTNVISIGILNEYRSLLDEDRNTQQEDVDDLESALRELVNVGLAAPNEKIRGILNIHPVLPYFLRYKLRQSQQRSEHIYVAFYKLYLDFGQMIYARYLCSLDPGIHSLGQEIMRAEYANMNFALAYGLANHLPIEGIMAALEEYLDQTKQQEARRDLLEKAISAYEESDDMAQQTELAKLHAVVGMTARDQHRLEDALKHFTSELHIARAISNDELQADAYEGIGSIAFAAGRYAEAESNYRNALRIETKSNADARSAAIHERLCAVNVELGRLSEAQAEIKRAIEIFDRLGDEQRSSIARAELGNVYFKKGLYEEAIDAYHVGLNFYIRYNDRHGAAGIYYMLSLATLAQGLIDKSDEHIRTALQIYLELSDEYISAMCYMQLGRIALISHRPSEASALFERARSIYARYGDYQQAADAERMIRSVAEEH